MHFGWKRATTTLGFALASCLPSLGHGFGPVATPTTTTTTVSSVMRPMATATTTIMTAAAAAASSRALFPTSCRTFATSMTALSMVQNRGLEVRREGATPTEGGMTLYCKAGPDGTSLGDCPFTHFVRIVLEEKGLEYELQPCVQDTKPAWLVEFYEGKMPALRHRKECYVESNVIAEYLDFFFKDPPLKPNNNQKAVTEAAESAVEGLFPAVAKYFKHTPDGDEDDDQLKKNLEASLEKLNHHLSNTNNGGPYLTGAAFSLLDCALAPKLYHLQIGVASFKDNAIELTLQFPAVAAYMDHVVQRPSFQNTVYPPDVVTWGWGNARK